MKKLVFFIIVFQIVNVSFSQISYNFPKQCTREDFSFTLTNFGTPDSVVWIWNDLTPNTTIYAANWGTTHEFLIPGVYNVKANVYDGGVVTFLYTKNVTVYDKPNLSIEYFAPSTVCSGNDSIKIQLDSTFLESPDLSMIVDWGDGSGTQTFSHAELGSQIPHLYNKTSCGNTVIIENLVVNDKFLIMVQATNVCTDLTPELIFRPVVIKSKPSAGLEFSDDSIKLDIETGVYQKCEPGEVTIINKSAGNGNECLNVNNVTWNIFNENNELIGQCLNNQCVEEIVVNFTDFGIYRIQLTQSNECGDGIVDSTLRIRPLPLVKFEVAEKVNCYPATLNFVNQSSSDNKFFIWDFIGDSTDVLIDSVLQTQERKFLAAATYNIKLWGYDGFCYNHHDSTLIFENLCEDIYVPNAFIPESDDEKFRTFRPKAQKLLEYRMDIYDMYGQHLYFTEEIVDGLPSEGWDGTFKGKPCSQGTYIWKIYAVLDNEEFGKRYWQGVEIKEGKNSTSGTFQLIR